MPTSSFLSRTLRAIQICAPSTDVGKTIFSTLLAITHRRLYPSETVHYLKPVSTGPSSSADSSHLSRYASNALDTSTALFQYSEPKSPHLVCAEPPSDQEVRAKVWRHFVTCADNGVKGTLFLETAGGVHSPSLSGSSQADLYRPFRLPVILIGDRKLGGISTTISAFESLRIRGYDVDGVMLFRDGYYQNDQYLQEYFDKNWGIKAAIVKAPPKAPEEGDKEGIKKDVEAMTEYYMETSGVDGQIAEILRELKSRHHSRIQRLESLASIGRDKIWYPFTQQQGQQPKDITTIDSAYGDHFQTLSPPTHPQGSNSSACLLNPMFDASASWWTQGLGHGNPKLSLAAAYAAGRYGHVMFASTAHEPAISLSELMISSLNNPRLSRVFYSDNGSTGCEVAIKMALKASRKRYGWEKRDGKEVEILGLKGAYHGDTIGAMDCADPGTYNKEVDWYRGKGYWFDGPRVGCKNGKWRITIPAEIETFVASDGNLGRNITTLSLEFNDVNDIFNLQSRKNSPLLELYEKYIISVLQTLSSSGRRFGALILEPVVLGAGGMLFIDPLFQHTLTTTIRANSYFFSSNPSSSPPSSLISPSYPESNNPNWSGLPIICDEVFTGLYRLGHLSSSSLIQINPDISIHAKLLTGGLVPLCTTLASESIFSAFLSNEKKDALLHGHSYTAHAVGCTVAKECLEILKSHHSDHEGFWQQARDDWGKKEQSSKVVLRIHSSPPQVWSVFGKHFVNEVSHHRNVLSVWAMGSVFAAQLNTKDGKGYSSEAATGFLEKLRDGDCKVHARALGNVVYVMTGQMTGLGDVRKLEKVIMEAL